MQIDKVLAADFGCGTRKKDDHFGIDIERYEGVDLVQDLRFIPLPFKDNQLEQAHCSHFLEHLSFAEVIYFMNEVWRVLKPEGIFDIVVPHGMSYAGMADLSHLSYWTEDTFGYFTPENVYYYSWFYEKDGKRFPVINKWSVISNDATPKYTYTKEGFLENKLREIHAYLQKLP